MRQRLLTFAATSALLVSAAVLGGGTASAGYSPPAISYSASSGWIVSLTIYDDTLRVFFTGTALQFSPGGYYANQNWNIISGDCSQDAVSRMVTCNTTDNRVEVLGSSGNDTITAEGAEVYLSAGGGDGDDHITAGLFAADLVGDVGSDVLTGSPKADILDGGDDADYVTGGSGPDVITGGPGVDRLFGDAGIDHLHAKDSTRDDTINCGAGKNSQETAPHDAIDPTPVSC